MSSDSFNLFKLVSLSSSLFCPLMYLEKIYVPFKLNLGMFSQNIFSNCNLLFEICSQYVKYNVHLLIEVISSHFCGCIHSQITASIIGCLNCFLENIGEFPTMTHLRSSRCHMLSNCLW